MTLEELFAELAAIDGLKALRCGSNPRVFRIGCDCPIAAVGRKRLPVGTLELFDDWGHPDGLTNDAFAVGQALGMTDVDTLDVIRAADGDYENSSGVGHDRPWRLAVIRRRLWGLAAPPESRLGAR